MAERESTHERVGTGVFESLYQGRGMSYSEGGPRMEVIPWRLDGPQPLITELEAAGEILGPVLECGCGLGDNALFLAEQGYEVTAFDAAPTVIEYDRGKASARGVPVRFMIADATTLAGIPGGFRTVLDCAMLHCLTDDQRRDYLCALRQVCEPGARLHVLCFQGDLGQRLPIPVSLDESSLRQAFRSEGWSIQRMQTRRYTSGLTPQAWKEQVPAELTQAILPDLDTPGNVDEAGRALLPIWQITARLT